MNTSGSWSRRSRGKGPTFLRRMTRAAKDDLLEVLLSCPVKGFLPRLKRRREPRRKVRL